MTRSLPTIILLLACLAIPFFSPGQSAKKQNLQEVYKIKIVKTTEKMAIDGHLREEIWQTADVATDFWYSYPIDDKRVEAKFQTEIRMAYDDNFIYLAAVCHDGDQYIIPTLKRDSPDFWQGDAFAFALDPVNERTNGFMFGVNPAGVQMESLITGQTGRRGDQGSSQGINGAWDNKWFSEVKTYGDQWIVEIAIPFKTLRFNDEKDVWGVNFIRGEPETNSYHTWSPVPVQFRGVDLGYTGALVWDKAPKKVKSNISVIPYLLGSSFKDFEESAPNELDFRAGADAKIAITSGLNLDVTVNPDFSQVDVDEQVTNLTRFNVRFPERRLFFLENSDLFENFGIPPIRPFFSRRIGLDDEGATIPILYGLRLSGNLNKDLRLGLMNMQTRKTDLEPGQNYTSLALHQRVLKRSTIKGYFHNQQAMNDGDLQNDNYNRNAGLEFTYQSPDGRWRGVGSGGLTFNPGANTDNYLYTIGAGYDGRHLSAYSNIAGVGNNYYADMGFAPRLEHYDALRDTILRVGFHHQYTRVGYTFYPEKHPKVITHQVELQGITDLTTDMELISNSLEAVYSVKFANTSFFAASIARENTNLLFPFSFIDGKPLPAGRYNFNYIALMYQTDQRKVFQLDAGLQYGDFYNGRRNEYTIGARYRAQPWGNFGLTFVFNELNFPDDYGSENLFLISPRLEINFSTKLFWTTFLQYNTQGDNFNINSRLQWRFQPMSDLFIVYSDNYAVEFWGPKNRALVLKVNYWLNL